MKNGVLQVFLLLLLMKNSTEESQQCSPLISLSKCIDSRSCAYLMEIADGKIRLITITAKSICFNPNPEYAYFCCKHEFVSGLLPTYNICGQELPDDRIAGGEDTRPQDYLWHALLIYEKSGVQKIGCGGSLITKNLIITAAHCVNKRAIEIQGVLKIVRLGEFDVDTTNNIYRKDFQVDKIILHPSYNEKTKSHDIAIVQLKDEVDIIIYNPVCLPKNNFKDSKPGENVHVVGFGEDGITLHELSGKKQHVILPIDDSSLCHSKWKITENQLCAGKVGVSKDSCRGDSGGSLTTYRNSNFILEGIVSFGSRNCTAGVPGVYTRVNNYRNWILSTIRTLL